MRILDPRPWFMGIYTETTVFCFAWAPEFILVPGFGDRIQNKSDLAPAFRNGYWFLAWTLWLELLMFSLFTWNCWAFALTLLHRFYLIYVCLPFDLTSVSALDFDVWVHSNCASPSPRSWPPTVISCMPTSCHHAYQLGLLSGSVPSWLTSFPATHGLELPHHNRPLICIYELNQSQSGSEISGASKRIQKSWIIVCSELRISFISVLLCVPEV